MFERIGDPRIAEEHQPDDTIFSNEVQRGHLAAREYVYWGENDDEITEADVHSFTLTNACPQIDNFNGQNGEWFQLERKVVAASDVEGMRLTQFMGPIFRADDPEFDALRAPDNPAERGTLIRVPVRFWKVIWWVEAGALRASCVHPRPAGRAERSGRGWRRIGTRFRGHPRV